MAKKLTKKALGILIERTYCQAAEGLTINIMDIPKVFREAEAAALGAADVEAATAAVAAAVAKSVERYCSTYPGASVPGRAEPA